MFRINVLAISFGVIFTTAGQIFKVIHFFAFNQNQKHGSHAFHRGAITEIFTSFSVLLPIFIFYPSCILWCWFSPFALENFVPSVILMGSILVDLVTHLMIKHICNSRALPFQRYLVLIIAIFAANVCSVSANFGGNIIQWRSSSNFTHLVNWDFAGIIGSVSVGPANPAFNEGVVYILSVVSFLFVFTKLYRVVNEAADALNICVFKVDKKKKI